MLALALISTLAAVASARTCGTPGQWTTVRTQADLQKLADCTGEFMGSLEVTEGVTSLAPLAGITSTQLTLLVHAADGLQDLSGLEKLKHVKESLFVRNLGNVASLKGLEGLEIAETSLTIEGLPKLRDLSALRSFKSLSLTGYLFAEDQDFHGINIRRCLGLTSLKGLEKVEDGYIISLKDLPALKDLSDLPAKYELRRLLIKNVGITDFTTMPKITSKGSAGVTADTVLSIDSMPVLKSLDGLELLRGISNLNITNNANLESIDTLKGAEFRPKVTIERNEKLCKADEVFDEMKKTVPDASIKDNCKEGVSTKPVIEGEEGNPFNNKSAANSVTGSLALGILAALVM